VSAVFTDLALFRFCSGLPGQLPYEALLTHAGILLLGTTHLGHSADLAALCVLLQPWLLVGTIGIFACVDRPYIMIIASGIFTALVILIPTVWEYCLSPRTKMAISQKFEKVPIIGSRKSGGAVEKSKQSDNNLVQLGSRDGIDDWRNGKDTN
jgi:hypothetical protein